MVLACFQKTKQTSEAWGSLFCSESTKERSVSDKQAEEELHTQGVLPVVHAGQERGDGCLPATCSFLIPCYSKARPEVMKCCC